MSNTQVIAGESSVDQRRAEKTAAWCDRIREWDWVPVTEAIDAEIARSRKYYASMAPHNQAKEYEANFQLGGASKLMQRQRRDYSPPEWWVEEYCFNAALRQVAAEHGLTIIEYTDGSLGAQKKVPASTD